MAIGPTANAVGELQTLHVSPIAGCSSLKRSNRMRGSRSNSRLPANESNRQTFSFFCRPVAEERRVWVVPLKQALLWVGRPIAFLKVDAQGGDLEAVLSGGDLLHTRVEAAGKSACPRTYEAERVEHCSRQVHHSQFALCLSHTSPDTTPNTASNSRCSQLLEVIGDECAPLYVGQPTCSETIRKLARAGYAPPTPVHCTSLFPFSSDRHLFCEMDLIFVRQGAPIPTITSIASNDATGAQLTKEPQPQQQPPQQQTLPQAASPSHSARLSREGHTGAPS